MPSSFQQLTVGTSTCFRTYPADLFVFLETNMLDAIVSCGRTGQRFWNAGSEASITRISRRRNTEVASATLAFSCSSGTSVFVAHWPLAHSRDKRCSARRRWERNSRHLHAGSDDQEAGCANRGGLTSPQQEGQGDLGPARDPRSEFLSDISKLNRATE